MIFAAAISSTSAARSFAGNDWTSTVRSTGARRAESLFSVAASGGGGGSAAGVVRARATTRTNDKATMRAVTIARF